jgi:hypothetical protein
MANRKHISDVILEGKSLKNMKGNPIASVIDYSDNNTPLNK